MTKGIQRRDLAFMRLGSEGEPVPLHKSSAPLPRRREGCLASDFGSLQFEQNWDTITAKVVDPLGDKQKLTM